MAKVLVMMADYGHDPTGVNNANSIVGLLHRIAFTNRHPETAVPYSAFKEAGFNVSFATEKGKSTQCDTRMLQGITQLLLDPQGAARPVIQQYNTMAASEEWQHPLAWSAPAFTLDAFDLVFLPGGHEKSVRQIIDSEAVHRLLVDFFPKTRKPGAKAVGAVCHGVMVLSEAKDAEGRSVLHGCTTTTLPARFEQLAFWGTRVFLGDYYKTYGACSKDVEDLVRKELADPAHLKSSLIPTPFVVEDENFNYISARFPGDVRLMFEKLVNLAGGLRSGKAEAA
ncbi:Uncharacterized protein C14C4.04 [Tolypocladium ophioglossoides CBS 100239]|uniref:Uncharacterized protein C14C4.04 n=1 Tax=Tolypocladium ophioglossoides (strain CBS 100239) TaxID=1163406 RepID=A0A0L0N4U5_TOLOC|nr:Uncharacterized protein C14C4.04 [Tolypocladium ophioglossoides CBS 100239]